MRYPSITRATPIILSLVLLGNAFLPLSYSDELNQKGDSIAKVSANESYTGLEFLNEENLSSALYGIVDNHTALDYSIVWEALTEIDEDPANSSNVLLFYSRRSHSENDTCGNGNECSDQSWNREHLWPQSHGDFGTDTENIAGTDLHAIRPVDNTINSARSDRDFDNADSQHSECIDCNYSWDAWEPPNEIKGDVARSLFYMDLRYDGFGNEPNLSLVDAYTSPSTVNGTFGVKCTLYSWHISDPVTIEERARNDRVELYQGNRNPFVDRPGFIQKIWSDDCGIPNSLNCDLGSYFSFVSGFCKVAEPGRFTTENAFSQTLCTPGTWQDQAGQTSCIEAQEGHFASEYGSINETPCSPGTWQNLTGQQSCNDALPGHYVEQPGSTMMNQCSPGTYQPESGQISCIVTQPGNFSTTGSIQPISCEIGTFQSDPGADHCTEAQPGHFVNLSGATSQTQCSEGSFSAEVAQGNCTEAEPGHFVDFDGASSQSPCSSGSFQQNSGQVDCDPAPPGQTVSLDGSSLAEPCSPGTYQPNSGRTVCFDSSPGYYVNETGSSSQTACPPGHFQSNPGESECVQASSGSYVPDAGSAAQTPCPPGSFQSSSGQSGCIDAMPGHHVPQEGAVSQSTCRPGTFQTETGADACQESTPGHFVQGTGSPSQTPCEPGTYQEAPNAESCIPADPGFYVPESGSIEQLKCPSGQSQELAGQSSCKKPKRPLWLTIVIFAVPTIILGTMAAVHLSKRQKGKSKGKNRSYMYSEDMRRRT